VSDPELWAARAIRGQTPNGGAPVGAKPESPTAGEREDPNRENSKNRTNPSTPRNP
jgi:hypothetical protein